MTHNYLAIDQEVMIKKFMDGQSIPCVAAVFYDRCVINYDMPRKFFVRRIDDSVGGCVCSWLCSFTNGDERRRTSNDERQRHNFVNPLYSIEYGVF